MLRLSRSTGFISQSSTPGSEQGIPRPINPTVLYLR
jgi:hypothetical protein